MNRKIIDYKIAAANGADDFEIIVKSLLAKGYELLGAPTVIMPENKYGTEDLGFYQALVKYFPEGQMA